MDNIYYIIIAGGTLLLIIVLLVLLRRQRRRGVEKDHLFIRQLRERDSIIRELERTRIEKEAYEELLKGKIKDQNYELPLLPSPPSGSATINNPIT